MDDTEWKELLIDVMRRYEAKHPGERHTPEEWADLIRDEVYQEDMNRWYAAHPQYGTWRKAAAADDTEARDEG